MGVCVRGLGFVLYETPGYHHARTLVLHILENLNHHTNDSYY